MNDTTKDIRPVRDITNILDLDRRAEKYELFADEVLPDNYVDDELDEDEIRELSEYDEDGDDEETEPDESNSEDD